MQASLQLNRNTNRKVRAVTTDNGKFDRYFITKKYES